MTPRIQMPICRQLARDPDGPILARLRRWREPVVYEIVVDYELTLTLDGKEAALVLPAGFRSDLASTPRLSWLFGFRPDGPVMLAAWFHDYYYRHGHLLARTGAETRPWPHFQGRGKLWADRLFYLLARRVIGLRAPAWLALAALAAFGWPAWIGNALWRDMAAEPPWPNIKILHGDYTDDATDPD